MRIQIFIRKIVLHEIFLDCDRHPTAETGGRLVGFYHQRKDQLVISVSDTIDAGPNAIRSATHLQQDGLHQETQFRSLEAIQPHIEHLGTWHSHCSNGLEQLSLGDINTYQRTVNHPNHNLDFWCALLITKPVPKRGEYFFKNYVFHRGSNYKFDEIPLSDVTIHGQNHLTIEEILLCQKSA